MVMLTETRGAVVGMANLTANLGRGVGPALANHLMRKYHSRQVGSSSSSSGGGGGGVDGDCEEMEERVTYLKINV